MVMMQCRIDSLKHVMDGFLHTGVDLISYIGDKITQFHGYDDIGIYILVPKIARFFDLSLESALSLFFNCMFIGSFIAAFIGFYFLCQNWITRILSICGLLLLYKFCIIFILREVYLAYLVSNLAFIPLFLYLYKKKHKVIFPVFLYSAGFFLCTLHYIRGYSCLGTVLFITTLLCLDQYRTNKNKLILLISFTAGFVTTQVYFKAITFKYQNFVNSHLTVSQKDLELCHPFWHTIYVGFGLLHWNDNEIEYNDHFAFAKAHEVDPSIHIYTKQYEKVLKNKVLDLYKNHSLLVIMTLFSKIGVLLLLFLIFTNFGLINIFISPLSWQLQLAFLINIMTNALFPLIAMPTEYSYSLGFIVVAFLYGMFNLIELVSYGFNFFKEKYMTKFTYVKEM